MQHMLQKIQPLNTNNYIHKTISKTIKTYYKTPPISKKLQIDNPPHNHHHIHIIPYLKHTYQIPHIANKAKKISSNLFINS